MGIAKRNAATKKLLATLCFFKKCLPKKYIPTIGPKKAKAVIVIKNIALILGVSIRKVTNNRRDRRHDYRKTSRPFMRKMQTKRILRIWPEAKTLKFWVPEYLAAALLGSAMQLCRCTISPFRFQKEISTGSPLCSIVSAVV